MAQGRGLVQFQMSYVAEVEHGQLYHRLDLETRVIHQKECDSDEKWSSDQKDRRIGCHSRILRLQTEIKGAYLLDSLLADQVNFVLLDCSEKNDWEDLEADQDCQGQNEVEPSWDGT